jgi:hypothetical protein
LFQGLPRQFGGRLKFFRFNDGVWHNIICPA